MTEDVSPATTIGGTKGISAAWFRFHGVAAVFGRRVFSALERPLPSELSLDPERARRARLVAAFGTLGSLFGITYATFYLLIGHTYGAIIILCCSFGVALTPVLMCWKKSVEFGGHFLSLTLTLGFWALCFVEGGLKGHAIAWLVSVPLCSLLLVGARAAARWVVFSFFCASVIVGIDLAGITLPETYDPKWNAVVSSAGYLGLIMFMFLLGLIFESGRARAFAKMQSALSELATSNERLIYLNNEKNEFLGIAAHDLKNPLTVIAGSAELASMTKDSNQSKKLLTNIATAAKRMRDLITNLLDVNTIEEGKFNSKIEQCDIGDLVTQSIEHNQPAATRKSIQIRTRISEGILARADCAATLQVLDNLISNALKYSPPNTTIHIHTLPEKEFAIVSVRDEGPGISESDQKKLFQKFTRLTARPTAGESSTGLGLAIVKRLAEAMNGTVQCTSTLGNGSTFTLRLPSVKKPQFASMPATVTDLTARMNQPQNLEQFPGNN